MVCVKPFLINGERPCVLHGNDVIVRTSYNKDNPQQAIFYKGAKLKGVQLQRLSERGYPKEKRMDSKRQSELTGNSKTEAEMPLDLSKAYKDKKWFDAHYWEKQMSVPAIAKLCGRAKTTVYSWVWKHNWKLRKYSEKIGIPVSKETAEKIRDAQLGEKNHAWKGGRYEDQGYIRVKDHAHPYRNTSNYVAEHRLVVEKSIGRILYPWELVHHKNGIRNDNRIENLEIKYRGEHHRKSLSCPHCGKNVY